MLTFSYLFIFLRHCLFLTLVVRGGIMFQVLIGLYIQKITREMVPIVRVISWSIVDELVKFFGASLKGVLILRILQVRKGVNSVGLVIELLFDHINGFVFLDDNTLNELVLKIEICHIGFVQTLNLLIHFVLEIIFNLYQRLVPNLGRKWRADLLFRLI